MPCVCVCVSLSFYLTVLLCTVGYVCQYEPLRLGAESWACCGEITSRRRWQIVESEISLLQKSLQSSIDPILSMPSYKNIHWIGEGEAIPTTL